MWPGPARLASVRVAKIENKGRMNRRIQIVFDQRLTLND